MGQEFLYVRPLYVSDSNLEAILPLDSAPQETLTMTGDILVATTGEECYWHLVARGQGGC